MTLYWDTRPQVGPCNCEHEDHFDTDAHGQPKAQTAHDYMRGSVADGPSVPFVGAICTALLTALAPRTSCRG